MGSVVLPSLALGHGSSVDTVEEHAAQDSVTHTPAEEQRLGEQTEAKTAADAQAAAAGVGESPAVVGSWGEVMDWPVVGAHVALLESGKVVVYDSVSDEPVESTPVHTSTRAMVWDPAAPTVEEDAAVTGVNIFCSGLAHLMDGSLYVAGGNKNSSFEGIKDTFVFDSETNSWNPDTDMVTERWYPSVTPLRDGEMLITEGGPEVVDVPEVREVDGDMRQLTDAGQELPLYPWIDVAPDGRAFVSGPEGAMRSLDPTGTGKWQTHGQRDEVYRDYGSRAMYDVGKILVAGGGDAQYGDSERRSSVVIDVNGSVPAVTNADPMEHPRRQHNLTVLADGTVLATGGLSSGASLVDLDNGVFDAELWDPDTGAWTTLAPESVTRQYHSTALLLADGRVLSAGGGLCGDCKEADYLAKNAQVFSPPYLYDASGDLADRPTISYAPNAVKYDTPFSIETPDASSIGKVAMVRLGSVTHSVNMEQRYIPLESGPASGTVTATSPANANVAPPGVYMLFVMNNEGVPSVAKMVRMDADAVPPPVPPTITATNPASPANDSAPKVRGSGAAAGTTVRLYGDANCSGPVLGIGAADNFNGAAGITARLAGDRTTYLRATATNSSGNTSKCSAPFAYLEDSTPPETSLGEIAVSEYSATARFSSEVGATFECRVDDRPYSACASPRAYHDLTVGDHDFAVRATDAVGNTNPVPATTIFAVADVTPPDTRIVHAPKDGGTRRTTTFTFESSEPGSVFSCRLDGQPRKCGPQLSIRVSRGVHTLLVNATDAAGNRDPSADLHRWKIRRPRR